MERIRTLSRPHGRPRVRSGNWPPRRLQEQHNLSISRLRSEISQFKFTMPKQTDGTWFQATCDIDPVTLYSRLQLTPPNSLKFEH